MSTPASIDFRAFEGEVTDLERRRGMSRVVAAWI